MFTGYDMQKYHLPIDTYHDAGVENIAYVAELAQYIVDYFSDRSIEFPTKESLLSPYRDDPVEAMLSLKIG